ncbi:MAG: hypothetical protein E7629_02600 [Ruminococcaceae bacterium]|nr:hypothetical protein [Oscillospiraceae bacterium]
MLNKRIWKLLCCFLLTVTMLAAFPTVAAAEEVPLKERNERSVASIKMISSPDDSLPTASLAPPLSPWEGQHLRAAGSYEGLTVIPGGMPFGIKFYTEGVTVVGFCDVDTGSGKSIPHRSRGSSPRI